MTRCDYDTIFQRVFCVTLVAIAFTFTVILTNVFIDIDGLLSKKDNKAKPLIYQEPVLENEKQVNPSPDAIAPPSYYKADKIVEEAMEDFDENYRSKRSLESKNFLFHMRNPKMKGILTNRLATLLEELDREESNTEDRNKNERRSREKEIEDMTKDLFSDTNSRKEEKIRHKSSNTDEDLLHLAMHNILLQGIIGHMDLSEVYKKVHLLMNNFRKKDEATEGINPRLERTQVTPIKIVNQVNEREEILENIENAYEKIQISKTNDDNSKQIPNHRPSAEENKFIEEMANCDKLQTDVNKMAELNSPRKESNTEKPHQSPSLLIKTIIDITSLNKTHHKHHDPKEHVKGVIQLIYNGKPIKFSRMDEEGKDAKRFDENIKINVPDNTRSKYSADNKPIANAAEFNDAIEIIQEKRQEVANAYLNNLLNEYLVKDPQKVTSLLENVDTRHKFKTQRYKRQIKIKYADTEMESESEKKKNKQKKISLAKTNDDELYVEIETHFDSKGMKGEKKKKLIRDLIDKIQKAINTDINLMKESKKAKHKRFHVKKRDQHPLDKNATYFINKVMMPFNNIAGRQSEPISKVAPEIQNQALRSITDKSGESWKKAYDGPGFLTVSKSVNSAELGQVKIDYHKMIPLNEIPQRQQKPLNKASAEETVTESSFYNIGDMNFFIKDLDGTGLSIGFNQYTAEPPDPETMKLFTGIENMINNYQYIDDKADKPKQDESNSASVSEENETHDIMKRDVTDVTEDNKQHVVIRRSIKELNEKDYHSNEYKIIFDSNFLPYDNYEEIIEDKNKRIALKLNKDDVNDVYSLKTNNNDMENFKKRIKTSELPALMSENIFYEKLKPAEILNLASLLARKKRSVSIQKGSNTKKKIKVNKYINRRSRFGPKKLILTKKRSKRQIDKIRIIATDDIGKVRRGKESDENIFVVSDENVFADRAVIRDVEGPNYPMANMEMREQREENMHNAIPYSYDDTSSVNPFDGRFRMNSLMARYPHIIMEEITASGEQVDPFLMNKVELKTLRAAKQNFLAQMLQTTTETNRVIQMLEPNFEKNIDDLNIDAPKPKQNYKLTVRIMPRNTTKTKLNSGYKEIHTSINKSFNRDGKIYSSLYNVSEISKIENLNSTNPTTESTNPTTASTDPPMMIPTKPCFEKQMEGQQSKIDLLMNQHTKRIDEQLTHLKEERKKIENLVVKNILKKAKQSPEENENTTLLPKINLNQLLSLMKSQFETTTQATTTTTTTVATPVDNEKIIINTIRRNENLTNEILQQINRNTEVLQAFLMKLSERLSKDTIPKMKEEEVKPKLRETNNAWKTFNMQMPYPNMVQINDTQPPIPFVYAFQPPYPTKPKTENEPIASVVYHGLIHTNAYKDPKDTKKIVNQNKYFIDDVENGFEKKSENHKGVKSPEFTNSTSVKV